MHKQQHNNGRFNSQFPGHQGKLAPESQTLICELPVKSSPSTY